MVPIRIPFVLMDQRLTLCILNSDIKEIILLLVRIVKSCCRNKSALKISVAGWFPVQTTGPTLVPSIHHPQLLELRKR